MKYIIAEKPSLARSIAAELPGVKTSGDNCIIAGEYKVGWLAGHVLEMLKPEEYSEKYKSWKIEDLPIIPNEWKLKSISSSKGLLKSVKTHLKSASIVINAGDPDREGQLLVDEVLKHFNWSGPTKRLLVNDPSPQGVQDAIKEIVDNSQFTQLYEAGLARQRSDWIYGLNMTRLYTILGQKGGYDGVLSVGRVQTPVLGLIVQRFNEINKFVPKDFYEVFTKIKEVAFKWIPSNDEYLDDENRLIDKNIAESVKDHLNGKAHIKSIETKQKNENAPLTFSLAEIQMKANQVYDYSAQQVLNICQSLYETHKLVTYPRSDCQYLPEKHFDDRESIINTICSNIGEYKMWDLDVNKKSRVFNNKKITAHHALIPTAIKTDMSKLNKEEQMIYRLISERYLVQFLPQHKYLSTVVTAIKEEYMLIANGKKIIQIGWKKYFKEKTLKDQLLPDFEDGEEVEAAGAYLMEKLTAAPSLFTEATLLKAMQNIGKYVVNPALKQILKDTDGIGTPATQAQIIETLFKRNYVAKKGKNLIPTEVGNKLINILPDVAITPDMTAYWESYMSEIESGNSSLTDFMTKVESQMPELIEHGKGLGQLNLKSNSLMCPKCGKGKIRKGKFTYGCSDYKVCDFRVNIEIAGKKITQNQIENLITKKKSTLINGFISRKQTTFSAYLILTKDFKTKFSHLTFDISYAQRKKKKKRK